MKKYWLFGLMAMYSASQATVPSIQVASKPIKDVGFKKIYTFKGHHDIVQTMRVLKNGLLVSGSADCTIKIWDVDEGCIKRTNHNSKPIFSIEELADGRILYGSSNEIVRLWDYMNNKSTVFENLEKTERFLGPIIALDSKKFALCTREKCIKIWDIDKDSCLKTSVSDQHNAWISSLIALKNSSLLVSSSWDKTIRLWDTSQKKLTCIKTFLGHTDCINVVKQLNDQMLVSASDDKTIMLWNIDSSTSKTTFYGHSDRIYALLVVDGKIISGSRDRTVRIWDSLLQNCILIIPCSDKIYSLAFSTDKKYLFIGLGCGDIEVFQVILTP